ncbi:hypothetical protein NPX13_g3498 [Xylaria arbuscula]|uniref:Uncharacterized protein n=1 Tax=Xylaria arbuscula TaxID=114810 RepID=A0A9W8NID7_9PEZI|nr:hypothetical protein NPX13_g3498 [Xylaria arbuscula]
MGNIVDLNEYPRDINEAIASSTDSNDLIVKLLSRYNNTGDTLYLDTAIAKVQEAIQQLSSKNSLEDTELRTVLWTNLNGAMLSRYDGTGDAADLDAAIASIEQVVKDTPSDHPELASRLGSLSKTQLKQYGRTGDSYCLKRAYSNADRAVKMASRNDPARLSLLVALSTALAYLYEQTGEFATLERAISLAKEALGNVSGDIDPADKSYEELSLERATILSTLASLRYMRFKQKHDVEDLVGAISNMREATSLTSSSHPLSKSLLNNLGAILFAKYEHPPHDQNDLDDAISKVREAIEATPEFHPDLAGRLNNLSKMLYSQYKATRNIQCLEDAIAAGKKAAGLTSKLQRDTQQDEVTGLSSLSAMQLELYELKQQLTDLDEAIAYGRKAVVLTPLCDPNLADRLRHLEQALVRHFELTGDVKDREEADALIDERERLGN